MASPLNSKKLLLIGGGHAHIQLLKEWQKSPLPNLTVSLISDVRHAIYSGMVPGYIAGQYQFGDLSFDLQAICAKSNVTFIRDKASGLVPDRQMLTLESGQSLFYDILSINMGSTVSPIEGIPEEVLIPTRPISGLIKGIDEIFAMKKEEIKNHCSHIAVIGGGAAGYEIAVCMAERIRRERPGEEQRITISLIAGEHGLLSGMSGGLIRRAEKVLLEKGILLLNEKVTAFDHHILRLQSGINLQASKIIWAAGAAPHPEWKDFGISLSPKGFIPITQTLQNPEYSNIFAVGDSADWVKNPIPKAGVYSVRMGPVLLNNIKRMLKKGPSAAMKKYVPQSGFLRLLNNGDRTGIGNFHGINFRGEYVQKWKDKIDRQFMERFQIDRKKE